MVKKLSIHSIVKEILSRDPVALESLRLNILNTNAYAKKIKAKVEKRLKKKVKVNTITVAINRFKSKVAELSKSSKTEIVKPPQVTNLEVNTPIIVTAFAPEQKILVAVLNLVSDPKYKEKVVYLQYTQEELVIAYEQVVAKVINRWNAQVLWENKAALADIELAKGEDFDELLKFLECKGIKPYIVSKKSASNAGLLILSNEDMVKVITALA